MLVGGAHYHFGIAEYLIMQNSIVEAQPTNLPTNRNPFIAFASAVSPQQAIIGKLLRFNRGEYITGAQDDTGTVALGTRLMAALDYLSIGWVRWSAGKPVEHILKAVIDHGEDLPPRSALGHQDKSQWEPDVSGKPRDPWAITAYLPLGDVDAFTFVTASRGGLEAIGRLSNFYGRDDKSATQFPLVELGVGSYAHRERSIGRVKFPEFKPVGWAPKGGFTIAGTFKPIGWGSRGDFPGMQAVEPGWSTADPTEGDLGEAGGVE